MDGILHRIFQALPDIADTTHPGPLVPAKRLFIEFFGCNGTGADDGKIRKWKSWKVSHFCNLKDALREDRDQFYILLQTFLINSLDTLQAPACRDDIDLLWQMM